LPKLNYLRKRRGRYLVQMRVPSDIRHLFSAQNVEVYLGTADYREAARKQPDAVAEIRQRFAKAKSASLSSLDIEDAAQAYFVRMRRECHEASDAYFEDDEENRTPSGAVGYLMELEESLEDADWWPVAKEADKIAAVHGVALSDDQRAELSEALLHAAISALESVIALRKRGEVIERPAIFNSRAVDSTTWKVPDTPA